MAALTTQNVVAAGTVVTYGAVAAGGDTAEVGSGVDTFAHFKNTNGSTRTITIDMNHLTLETGVAYPDRVYTIGATTGELMIPLRKIYADAAQHGVGRCGFTYSADAGVTVAIIRMG